jgi:hypothetical protein
VELGGDRNPKPSGKNKDLILTRDIKTSHSEISLACLDGAVHSEDSNIPGLRVFELKRITG